MLARYKKEWLIKYGIMGVLTIALMYTTVPLMHMLVIDFDVEESFELAEITDEVKLAVDSISTFPVEAERPIISKLNRTKGALMVSISGNLDEVAMKSLAEDVRDEIIGLPEVTYAEVNGGRDFEISIEVDELTLRQYGLTLAQVANTIRNWSVDIPGGSIRTQGGDIRLRAKGQP